ncbi:MAG: TlpA disulfide reductase family protein [Dehalococcoidia bacterium]|nr:TlpA disulfide reductase family protein [Dehalococcoidia bacterium]
MIQSAHSSTDKSISSQWDAIATYPRSNVCRLLLLAFAAMTLVGVACGTSDGTGSETNLPPVQDPIATGAPAFIPVDHAADFEVSTPSHGVFNLDRLEGRPLVLNFWFPSCPPCRAELPDLQAAYEAHADEIQFLGVQLLGLDSAEEGQEFLDELGIEYPSGADTDNQMVRDFKIVGFPTTIFIDSDHNIVKKHAGILSAGSLEALINSTVVPASTPVDVSGS